MSILMEILLESWSALVDGLRRLILYLAKKKTFLLPLILTTDDLRHLARNSEYKYLGNVRSDDGDGYENVT